MGLLYDNITTLVTEIPRTADANKGKLDPNEYFALITILSVLVVMAIVFAIYGLFIKAEAHKHSDHLDNGNNLLFIGQDDSMFGTGFEDF